MTKFGAAIALDLSPEEFENSMRSLYAFLRQGTFHHETEGTFTLDMILDGTQLVGVELSPVPDTQTEIEWLRATIQGLLPSKRIRK